MADDKNNLAGALNPPPTMPSGPMQNPLAGLLALLGPSAAAPAASTQQAGPQPPAAVPQGGAAPTMAAPASSGLNPVIQGLMQQSQATMNAPMGQAVPGANPIAGLAQHPIVQALIKGLANAAQSYGWTAMMPQERLERTQLQQQKGEALARLAETGAYQEGMLGIRGQQAETQANRAGTYAQDVASKTDYRQFQEQNMQDRLALQQDANNWHKEMAAGRLDKAQQMIDQRASQFEQKFSLATKNYGLEAAKVELMSEGMSIKQGMLDLARTALSQRGTEQGAQMMSKIQQFKIEHPIMSQFMDLSDIDQLIGGAGQTGLPGVTGVQPQPQPTPTGVPQAGGKAAAKRNHNAPETPARPPNVPAGAQWDSATRTWRM